MNRVLLVVNSSLHVLCFACGLIVIRVNGRIAPNLIFSNPFRAGFDWICILISGWEPGSEPAFIETT